MTQAYPLQWPQGRPRSTERKSAPFGLRGSKGYIRPLSVSEATSRLMAELERLDGGAEILSTNIKVRLDGLPRSGQPEPEDSGVCLYFDLGGDSVAMPCDRYNTVAGNIAAIAAHIEATRKIERHGVASVKEMFTGFTALPSPNQKKCWREVFGLKAGRPTPSFGVMQNRYWELCKTRHPDKPTGSQEKFTELQQAWDEAKEELL